MMGYVPMFGRVELTNIEFIRTITTVDHVPRP